MECQRRWNDLLQNVDKNDMKMASTFIQNELDRKYLTLMELMHILHALTCSMMKQQVCRRNSLMSRLVINKTSQLCRRDLVLCRRSS